MSRRSTIRSALAVALGAGAAVLVACGSSSGKGLIPVASSEPLQSDFQEVAQAAVSGNGDCTATETALEKTRLDYEKLPASVDAGLRTRLREGIENLHSQALAQCSHASTNSTASTAKTTTTPTVTTDTTPTQTTETTPTETATAPSTTTTPAGGTSPGETPSEGNDNGGGGNGGVAPGQEDKQPKEPKPPKESP